ncbi:hypothetical protein C2G38_2071450 [Gigaspora rosea]|uniref:Uncharacterized protein n=1 Tax=Gigaspora rosea TaxID=44941 RepID=A0A397VS77_9GLOM|nr:hypothetical protein C2G38_2071450 [Gigaspora rosea]
MTFVSKLQILLLVLGIRKENFGICFAICNVKKMKCFFVQIIIIIIIMPAEFFSLIKSKKEKFFYIFPCNLFGHLIQYTSFEVSEYLY